MSFIYLATPYSKYKEGLVEANRLACVYAGEFIKANFPVFCPIAHSHAIAVEGNLQALDHSVWMPLDFAFTEAAFAMVVCKMHGWNESYGIGKEIDFFMLNKKPVFFWEPPELTLDLIAALDKEYTWQKEKSEALRPSLADVPKV